LDLIATGQHKLRAGNQRQKSSSAAISKEIVVRAKNVVLCQFNSLPDKVQAIEYGSVLDLNPFWLTGRAGSIDNVC
jgi:hypothetical protein